jgi:hypothetical protein
MCASPRSILWLIIAGGERENICCDRDLARQDEFLQPSDYN